MAIHVQTDFPGANACAVETLVIGDTDVVRFASAPHGGTEALWFCLRVAECSDRPVELVLTNIDTLLGGAAGWQNVRPVVRQAAGTWERAEPALVRSLPDGRQHAVWRVRPRYDSFEFALCYPYGVADMEIARVATQDYWRLDEIGVTGAGRRLPRLSNGCGVAPPQAPGVYLVARQHAGETPGSWVLDGLLRSAAGSVAPEALLIWAVPLANLDGVVAGDYGKDPFPHDLNRAWGAPPMRHEVHVIGQDLRRWAGRCRPQLVVDLHAPAPAEADGAYFFLPRAAAPPAQLAACQAALAAILPALPAELLHPQPARQPSYPSRWNPEATIGRFAWEELRVPALSLETPYSACRELVLTRDHYRRLGAALLDGICAWCSRALPPA